MELSGKLVSQTEIKSAADVIYETFSSKQYHIANICPDKILAVELHEGDWGTVDAVITSRYNLDGNALIAQETVEAIDKENKSITFNVFGGDLMQLYKAFKMIVQVVKQDQKDFVRWTMEYEKLNENIPAPNVLMDFGIAITKDVDAHYLAA